MNFLNTKSIFPKCIEKMICMRIFVTMAVFRLSDAAGMEIDHICNTRKNQPEYDNLSVLVVLYACETYRGNVNKERAVENVSQASPTFKLSPT